MAMRQQRTVIPESKETHEWGKPCDCPCLLPGEILKAQAQRGGS